MALSLPEGRSIVFNESVLCADRFAGSEDAAVDEIIEIAESRLRATGYSELRHVECSCSEGLLILRGRVASYFQKQLAQEAVRTLSGKRSILNEVEVVESDSKR